MFMFSNKIKSLFFGFKLMKKLYHCHVQDIGFKHFWKCLDKLNVHMTMVQYIYFINYFQPIFLDSQQSLATQSHGLSAWITIVWRNQGGMFCVGCMKSILSTFYHVFLTATSAYYKHLSWNYDITKLQLALDDVGEVCIKQQLR